MAAKTAALKERASKTPLEYRKLLGKKRRGMHPYVVFLGLDCYDTPTLLREIEDGFSYVAFEKLKEFVDVSMQELANFVQISHRTLNRRKAQGKLGSDESDRLVRLSRVLWRTLEMFEGDFEAARRWLSKSQVGLGGAAPLELVKSEVGAREIEALIGRLEHGVFS